MASSSRCRLWVCSSRLLVQSDPQECRFTKFNFDVDFADACLRANDGSASFKYFDPSGSHGVHFLKTLRFAWRGQRCCRYDLLPADVHKHRRHDLHP